MSLRFNKPFSGLAGALFLLVSAMAYPLSCYANTSDSTDILIQVVHQPAQERLSFTGSVASKSLQTVKISAFDQEMANVQTIGSFGIRSNMTGKCQLEFTSKNHFKLKHSIVPNLYSAHYQLEFTNQNLKQSVDCNMPPKALRLKFTKLNNINKAAIQTATALKATDDNYFWDTLMITVIVP